MNFSVWAPLAKRVDLQIGIATHPMARGPDAGAGVRRTLVVTNDLPPRPGGIQTYVHQMLSRQPEGSVVVLASTWRGSEAEWYRRP